MTVLRSRSNILVTSFIAAPDTFHLARVDFQSSAGTALDTSSTPRRRIRIVPGCSLKLKHRSRALSRHLPTSLCGSLSHSSSVLPRQMVNPCLCFLFLFSLVLKPNPTPLDQTESCLCGLLCRNKLCLSHGPRIFSGPSNPQHCVPPWKLTFSSSGGDLLCHPAPTRCLTITRSSVKEHSHCPKSHSSLRGLPLPSVSACQLPHSTR